MIPRVDYITLQGGPTGAGGSSVNASGSGYAWQIPPSYFKNFQAGDRLQVELVGCSFDALPAAGQTQNRPAIITCNLPSMNSNDLSGEVPLGITAITYISGNGGLLSPKNEPQVTTLTTNRFDNISINVYTYQQLNITQVSGAATGICYFILKISYFDNV